ncbi:MAG: glycosyltransferase [Candidatus Thiodiazotropha sp.]
MEYDFQLDINAENNSHTQLAKRIPEGSRVLELGCATGYMSDYLRRKKDCYVVGVEYDKSMANKAKKVCNRVIIADVQKGHWLKSLADERFDIIVCADILEHLREPIGLLKMLPGLLTEQGCLLASLPNGAHAALRLELLEGRFTYEDTGLLDRTHLHLFTYHSLRELFARAGFRVEELSYTFHDMADSEIVSRLKRLGFHADERGMAIFHTPDAAAFQFIVSAKADDKVSADDFPSLTDKPMASSVEVYRNLLDQLHQAGEAAATRLEMVAERDRILEVQQQHLKAFGEIREQMTKQQEELSKALAEEGSRRSDLEQEVKRSEECLCAMQQELKMSEKAVRAMEREKFLLKMRLAQHKESLHNITHSRGWRIYMVLMLPLRLLRWSRPVVQQLIRQPRLLKEWWREAKMLYKAGGVSAIKDRVVNQISPTYTYLEWIRDVEFVGLPEQDVIKALNEREDRPLISIVMPVYNVEEAWLREAIDSVLAQTYDDWELCIADDASTKPHVKRVLKEYEKRFRRIKVVYREINGHISAATNSALALATGKFVGLMDHDDVLAPYALFFVAQEIVLHPNASLIYSDEDKINSEGIRYDHYFKPDFNPDLMRSHNMICHFGVYRRTLLEKIGGIREGYEGAQDYDLALRCLREIDLRKDVRHIQWVLYHWRAIPESTASGAEAKSYAMEAAINAVKDDLNARNIEAKVTESDLIDGMIRVQYPVPKERPLVSIIIPTRNGEILLRQCLDSIRKHTDYKNYEIVVVDNQSDEPKTLSYLSQLEKEPGVSVLRYNHPFNFSAINNFAVEQTKGEMVCFMNDDIEVIASGWLDEMVSQGARAEIGAVGARLWYPDGRLQHGGVILGLGGVAGHAMKYSFKGERGYMGRSLLIQNYTAVTAACLLVKRDVFNAVSGFDSENLAVAFNDVDLCIRIYQLGFYNVWTPYAEMIHHESASRGLEDTPEKQKRFAREAEYMLDAWGPLLMNDPAYNPNLTRCSEDFSLNWKGVNDEDNK